ncbi:MAG: MerR family transcriptional regulator [Lachnospiraceae bacterium]|nr:MerR family transcriptional regulator [Lachnospiraceae bacterium]
MGEVHYMISEAAKRVGVEAHVLRYWEEELDLPIGRTEMGHRYYTEDDIRLFHCIKDLKEQSMQLRELKTVIPELKKAREQKKKKLAEMEERENNRVRQSPEERSIETPKRDIREQMEEQKRGQIVKAQPEVVDTDKFLQVQNFIGEALQKVIAENNTKLAQEVSHTVTKNVLGEMETLFHMKEQKEEEHYRKLDSLIRQQQQIRRESVKASPVGKLRKLFEV